LALTDTPPSESRSPRQNGGANMTEVAQCEYDGGATGGNGNQTKVIRVWQNISPNVKCRYGKVFAPGWWLDFG
jgi:hypothetical protein